MELADLKHVVDIQKTGDIIRQWMDTCLDNYERVEIFCSVLNAMTKLEVRYFHTVLHSIMNHDMRSRSETRDLIRKTNNAVGLKSFYQKLEPGFLMSKEKIRCQLILDLSLLHPENTTCAEIICDYVDRSDLPQTVIDLVDPHLLSDLLMIVTMAFRHPAFRFHQRLKLGSLMSALSNRIQELSSKSQEESSGASKKQPAPDTSSQSVNDLPSITNDLLSRNLPWIAFSASRSTMLDQKDKENTQSSRNDLDSNCITSFSNEESVSKDIVKIPAWSSVNDSRFEKPVHYAHFYTRKTRLKTCYHCGKKGHLGQNCRDRSHLDPLFSDFCTGSLENHHEHTPLHNSHQLEVFYAPPPTGSQIQ